MTGNSTSNSITHVACILYSNTDKMYYKSTDALSDVRKRNNISSFKVNDHICLTNVKPSYSSMHLGDLISNMLDIMKASELVNSPNVSETMISLIENPHKLI